MEFSVEKGLLLKELTLAQGVVEKKTTIPILANLLLETGDGQLKISATDLELGLRCGCAAKVKQQGSGTVPAKRLLEIVRALPDSEIKIKLLENHWVHLSCARSSFKLVGMSRENYPALPELPKAVAEIAAAALSGMIRRTIFSISGEESRYTLNGALLILKPDSASMVATDGHRLALIEQDLEIPELKNEFRILIPKRAMAELERLLAEADPESKVEIAKDESHLHFKIGHRTLMSRMLTGQFPNYEAVLPRENTRLVELEKEAIAAAIRRVALMADQRSHAIRFQIGPGKLEIFSSSGDSGEGYDEIETEYNGEPFQIGFNYEYLLDFFNVADGEGKVRFELKDEQSAGQLRPGEEKQSRYRYVVMPMRV